jgi:predicted nuclease of predicted toxin-antitoxin system
MNLYLDDDSVRPLLIRLLRHAGHDVQLPRDVGRMGNHDAVHLRHAVQSNRVMLTHNHRDFQFLNELIMDAQGHHPGILVVRRDNDRKRDLTPSGIVRALTNLLAAQVPLADHLHVLNHWR